MGPAGSERRRRTDRQTDRQTDLYTRRRRPGRGEGKGAARRGGGGGEEEAPPLRLRRAPLRYGAGRARSAPLGCVRPRFGLGSARLGSASVRARLRSAAFGLGSAGFGLGSGSASVRFGFGLGSALFSSSHCQRAALYLTACVGSYHYFFLKKSLFYTYFSFPSQSQPLSGGPQSPPGSWLLPPSLARGAEAHHAGLEHPVLGLVFSLSFSFLFLCSSSFPPAEEQLSPPAPGDPPDAGVRAMSGFIGASFAAREKRRCPHNPAGNPAGNPLEDRTRDRFCSVSWVQVPASSAAGTASLPLHPYAAARSRFLGRNGQKLAPACRSVTKQPPSIPSEHPMLQFMLIRCFLSLRRVRQMQNIPN